MAQTHIYKVLSTEYAKFHIKKQKSAVPLANKNIL